MTNRRILIHCNLGGSYGMGHAVRCRALAQALAARGSEVMFVTQTPALLDFVAPMRVIDEWQPNMSTRTLDAYVIDVQHDDVWVDERWHGRGIQVVWIDHAIEHTTPCDLLIYPNAHQPPATLARLEADFPGRVLHGWDYVMLDPEVTRQVPVPYQERTHGPIVFYAGGSDPDGVLRQMYHWAAYLDVEAPKVFLTGQYATDLPVASDAHGARGRMWVEPFERRWLRSAALVVTMFGMTPYECLYYETPVLCFPHRAADREALQRLAMTTHAGIRWGHVWDQCSRGEEFCALVHTAWDTRSESLARDNPHLIDGHGTERVADAILLLGREHHV